MNYRHIFHAGNFADVFKHIILIILIKTLQNKKTPLFYLDTHAGIGRYDLFSQLAQKTKEYENGINKIIKNNYRDEWINSYLHIIANFNNKNIHEIKKSIQYYPGSPLIVKSLLRVNDRMVLTELHPEDVQMIKNEFKNNKQVEVHLNDGYLALKAFLPPKEKRGLIFIDPPFEEPNEFDHIVEGLKNALSRFRNGVYALWYPIKNREPIKKFHTEVAKLLHDYKIENKLIVELKIHEEETALRLNGCGLVIINPPWKIDLEIKKIVLKLQDCFLN